MLRGGRGQMIGHDGMAGWDGRQEESSGIQREKHGLQHSMWRSLTCHFHGFSDTCTQVIVPLLLPRARATVPTCLMCHSRCIDVGSEECRQQHTAADERDDAPHGVVVAVVAMTAVVPCRPVLRVCFAAAAAATALVWAWAMGKGQWAWPGLVS